MVAWLSLNLRDTVIFYHVLKPEVVKTIGVITKRRDLLGRRIYRDFSLLPSSSTPPFPSVFRLHLCCVLIAVISVQVKHFHHCEKRDVKSRASFNLATITRGACFVALRHVLFHISRFNAIALPADGWKWLCEAVGRVVLRVHLCNITACGNWFIRGCATQYDVVWGCLRVVRWSVGACERRMGAFRRVGKNRIVSSW